MNPPKSLEVKREELREELRAAFAKLGTILGDLCEISMGEPSIEVRNQEVLEYLGLKERKPVPGEDKTLLGTATRRGWEGAVVIACFHDPNFTKELFAKAEPVGVCATLQILGRAPNGDLVTTSLPAAKVTVSFPRRPEGPADPSVKG